MKKKIILIIVLVVFILFGSGMTYSIFTSNVELDSSTSLALFVVDARKTNHIDIPLSNLKPGENISYNFSISNNSQNRQSDVTIIYNITIKTMHFMPLDISLYDSEDNLILTCDETYNRNNHNELECTSNDIEMPYLDNIKDDYSLKLEFPSRYNTTEYSSLVDFINLEINSYQKID